MNANDKFLREFRDFFRGMFWLFVIFLVLGALCKVIGTAVGLGIAQGMR